MGPRGRGGTESGKKGDFGKGRLRYAMKVGIRLM